MFVSYTTFSRNSIPFSTFNESNIYYLIEYGPIKEKTIYVLDPKTGAIKSGWGSDMFYMPHGMTIDTHGNYWITDVAMHQAFKVLHHTPIKWQQNLFILILRSPRLLRQFRPFESKPQLVIGKRFRPGASVKQLCKPTSIAVATTGEVG